MGRILEGGLVNQLGSLSISGTLPTKVVPAGYMGEFGTGLYRVFTANDTFTVPAEISRIRVRVIGGGGGGSDAGRGGAGGGYAHGVFDVTAGTNYAVTVGNGGTRGVNAQAGGASSFGALISATGGGGGNSSTNPTPGSGTGGDFQANGGTSQGNGLGGGGAGSQLGNGGAAASIGGGGIVGNSITGSPGGPFGPGLAITGVGSSTANPINAVIRFPFDGFVGGGTGSALGPGLGGIGIGGSNAGGKGGIGGGGAGSGSSTAGDGGYGAGGGGSGSSLGGNGGQGLVIVEW